MTRDAAVRRLADEHFDVVVIGGGATGLGAAVDAAARGYVTALIEADDFAKATSSRSTKLVHGGVRYLEQGNVDLVREALRERSRLLRNAPHLVNDLEFVVPAYRRLDVLFYGAGLAAYDLLAGRSEFARSRIVSATGARARIPALVAASLRGAVVYHDGQFDDARLAIALARTAVDRGAVVANYVRATGFAYDANRRVIGVEALDRETGAAVTIRAQVAINATGIFVDAVRTLDDPRAARLLAFSRGSHVVVRPDALGRTQAALLVPKTSDGRVLFAVPWHGRVVIGTTDVPVAAAELDPHPSEAEIGYILETVNRYLAAPLARRDVLATFAGLRPLVNRRATTTAKMSREHLIDVSASGIVTITGGKWTTYRKMAEDVVDVAARSAGLRSAPSSTASMPLHGATSAPSEDDALRVYGSDAAQIAELIRSDVSLGERLHPDLAYPRACVVYAAREEMARTVEDVLARRTRTLFLDANAARECAPQAAELIARELGRDATWAAEQVSAFAGLAAAAT